MQHKRKQRAGATRQSARGARFWMWSMVIGILLALGGLLVFAAQSQTEGGGILVAESPLQDVGQVSMAGGHVEVTFPLTVQGEVQVTGITTS